MPVPILATFDVSKASDRQRFLQFIQRDMRQNLRSSSDLFVFGSASVGRLPPQEPDPANAELKDLVIRNGDREIALRLRTDNLYVVGFRNQQGTWFEFRHDGHNRGPLIQENDRRELRFNGSYTSSRGIGSLDNVVYIDAQNRGEAILGEHAIGEAVINLSSYTGENQPDDDIKVWLRSLIVNLVESTRFNPMAERVHDLLTHPAPDTHDEERQKLLRLTGELVDLLHEWGSLSEALVLAANSPEQEFTAFHTVGVHNAFTAATTLGIVLITLSASAASSSSSGRHGRRLLAAAATAGSAALTLVEVVGVLIDNIDRENPGDLYGTIRITDGFGTETLFDRDHHHSQSVGPGGWADLTWPARPISGADDFVIDVHLMDYDRVGPDDHVADGQVAWNSGDTVAGDHDALTKTRVDGAYGSAQVHYAVLTRAVAAAVRVEVVDGDGEAWPDVYGTVTATTTMASGQLLQYKLFDTPKDDDVGVRQGDDLPLTRKLVSAALGSDLEIDANLWDRDMDLSPNDQIALGTAVFQPQLTGDASQEITGQYGKVKVVVTWITSFQHV